MKILSSYSNTTVLKFFLRSYTRLVTSLAMFSITTNGFPFNWQRFVRILVLVLFEKNFTITAR